MVKKTPKPAMVDLTQFESLEQALARITVIEPFDDLARQIFAVLHRSGWRVGAAVRILREFGQSGTRASRGNRA